MPDKKLTHSQKRDIHESIGGRIEKLNTRLDKISDGQTIPKKNDFRLNEAKKYELAMVFVDIDGFTNYLIDHGPHRVLYLLGMFVPEAMKLVKEYDGYFEKNTGDGLFAYFGFEKTPEESIADMLQYITTVRWVISNEVNPRIQAMGFEPVSISSGATYGTTHLSRIGVRAYKQELNRMTAVSTQANIAYTLENIADADEHLVGPNVHFNADDADSQFLNFHDINEKYEWTHPMTGEDEPYSIYKYIGIWSDESDQTGRKMVDSDD